MSVVTNVLLTTHCAGNHLPLELNKWLQVEMNKWGNHEADVLQAIQQAAGGGKAMELQLWAGAFNYLPVQEFVDEYFRILDETEAKHTSLWEFQYVSGLNDFPSLTCELMINRQDDHGWDLVNPLARTRKWSNGSRRFDEDLKPVED